MSNPAVLARSLNIPARPQIVSEVLREMSRERPDLRRLAILLKRDVSLHGAVLHTVNSTALGMGRKIASIDRAVALLGAKRVRQIIQVTSLRSRLGSAQPLNRFWDTASEVADIMTSLAEQFTGISTEDAYTVGLFHDLGIPLMMQAFPDFRELLQRVNQTPLLCLAAEETDRYGFSHYDVGYELGKLWSLPLHLNQAIRFQPHLDDIYNDKVVFEDGETIKTLLALLDIAKDISSTYRRLWRSNDASRDNVVNPRSLIHLGLLPRDFGDLREDYLHRLDHLSCADM